MFSFKIPWDDIEKELELRVESLFSKLFDTIDDTSKDIIKLKEKFPNLNEMALAHELIKESSTKTAVIGGGAALPDLVPGFGFGIMITTLAGDFCLTLREEMSMFLRFSFLFEPDSDLDTRKKDIINLLIFMAKENKDKSFAKDTIEDLQKLQIDVVTRKVAIRAGVQLGLKFFRKKLFTIIPGLGIALSGGLNYLGTRQVGRLGISYFQDKVEFVKKYSQGAVNLEITQQATIQMLINLIKMGNEIDKYRDHLTETMDMFGYTEEIQKAFFEDLHKKEITPISVKDIRAMNQDDRRYVLKQGLKLFIKPNKRQENYIEFINRAFGLTQSDLREIYQEINSETNN